MVGGGGIAFQHVMQRDVSPAFGARHTKCCANKSQRLGLRTE